MDSHMRSLILHIPSQSCSRIGHLRFHARNKDKYVTKNVVRIDLYKPYKITPHHVQDTDDVNTDLGTQDGNMRVQNIWNQHIDKCQPQLQDATNLAFTPDTIHNRVAH